MTGREKLERALAHQAGPVPLDLGATSVTGIHCSVVEGLRKYYGLDPHPVPISDPYQMLGILEDDLLNAMGIDTGCIFNDATIFGFPLGADKEWVTPWGQTVLVSKEFQTTVCADGSVLIYPCGDLSSPPCARMPASGYFFDTIIRGHDYQEDSSNVQDNLEEFQVLEPRALQVMKQQLRRWAGQQRGLVAQVSGCAIGDVALVPAPMLRHPKGLRDITQWYMATVADPDYLHQIFQAQVEIALQNLPLTWETLGDAVSVVFLCGTDFGMQNVPFCSNETFRDLYAPYYRRMNDWVHEHTTWKTMKHSCGSIRPLLKDLVEVGFDIINPVQWSARNMDPVDLKKTFGADITFWGGGVNTQKTLPFGTPEEVRTEALQCLETFARDGGYVFSSIHNIQAKTPVENVAALVAAVHEFNGEAI